jgi:hypothetical protein
MAALSASLSLQPPCGTCCFAPNICSSLPCWWTNLTATVPKVYSQACDFRSRHTRDMLLSKCQKTPMKWALLGPCRTANPFLGHAKKERVSLFGTDQRITSGPAARRPHSKAEYMTAPERFADSQIPLASRAPSIHDPKRSSANAAYHSRNGRSPD